MTEIVSLKSVAERYYKRANNASYAGKLPEAVYYYKQALNADKKNKKYFIDFISVLNQIGFFADTLSYGAEALSLSDLDSNDMCAIYFYMGEACYCLGLNEAATRYIDLCINIEPQSLFCKDAMLYKNELDKYFGSVSSNDIDHSSELFVDISSIMPPGLLPYDIFSGSDDPEDNLRAYETAETVLETSSGNVGATLLGYSSSIRLNNSFGKKKYRSLIRSIKDLTELDLQMLCNFFTYSVDDEFAKEIFANIYNENTFSREAGYALAVAFYNTGETSAALNTLKRVDMLEGGEFLASLLIKNISMEHPPARLSYMYAPSAEQMDVLCSILYKLLEKTDKSDGDYGQLESLLMIVIRFTDSASLGEIIPSIDISDDKLRTIIKTLLCKCSIEPSKKVLLALMVLDVEPDCNAGVNIMGDIVNLQEFSTYFKMRNFDVPMELELRFGKKAVGEVYYLIPSLGILDMTAPDNEFSFVADYLLTSRSCAPDIGDLALRYGIDAERAAVLSEKLEEKRMNTKDETY